LASTVNQALGEKARLSELLRKLQAELATLQNDKERLLGEYRSGLFCSGCGKTRSQILAKGESFPHPGQKIVQPTEKEIREKERSLQAPIEALLGRVNNTQKALLDETQRSSEGIDQLLHGLRLWQTAATFWTLASEHGLHRREEQLRVQLAEVTDVLARTRHAMSLPGAKPALATEAEVLERQLRQRQQALGDFGNKARQTSADLQRRRTSQSQRIAEALARPHLVPAISAPSDYRAVTRLESPLMLGAFFQMGALPTGGWAPTGPSPLPAVAAFVARYKASPLDHQALYGRAAGANAAPNPASAPRPLPANSSLLDKLP